MSKIQKRLNKKRNTAFLYECLIREFTKAVLSSDSNRQVTTLSILKKYFNKSSILGKELELYKTLYENDEIISSQYADKILQEVKRIYMSLSPKNIFKAQSDVIDNINKELEPSVFSNFIPNYKTLASIYQIFNAKTPIKTKLMLEEKILESLTENKQIPQDVEVDNLSLKVFIEKFNQEYSELLEEQRTLLQKYILSFNDNEIDLKVYLNEEIGRLRKSLQKSKENKIILEDVEMLDKTEKVLEIIDSFKQYREINEEMIEKILHIQELEKELCEDAN